MNLRDALSENRCFVVCDGNVSAFAESLTGGVPSLRIIADEAHKTIGTVLDICRWLFDNGAGRDAVLIAVGGGITSDVAGLAASLYMRGIRFGIVPTTLLSMVDASIGGKTGVNMDAYKNILGTFREPEFTHIDLSALETLPEREFRCGVAELLKTFLVSDGKLYERAVSVLSSDPLTVADVAPLIEAAVKIKSSIVHRDPFDKGLRHILNFGHTWAHAIEWKSDGAVPHGEAVSMGMVAAAVRSEALGLAPAGLADRLRSDFEACGLPTDLPFPEEELMEVMRRDKKVSGGKLNMVLLRKPGKAVVVAI